MENPIRTDKTQAQKEYFIPEMPTGCWTFTMEACLLDSELRKAVSAVFEKFPEIIQRALTFAPESGGRADRARFWQTVLKLALPPRQYHAVMRKFLAHYARVLRKRREALRQYDLPSEQDFMQEAGQFFCECYRMGAAGEPSPFAETFEAEARALSAKAGEPVEQAAPGVRLMYRLGCSTYADGAKLRYQLLGDGVTKG